MFVYIWHLQSVVVSLFVCFSLAVTVLAPILLLFHFIRRCELTLPLILVAMATPSQLLCTIFHQVHCAPSHVLQTLFTNQMM